jgi:uncharacterized protein (DUF58 family)
LRLRPGVTLLIGSAALALIAALGFVMPYAMELTVALGLILILLSAVEGRTLQREIRALEISRVAPRVTARGRSFAVRLQIQNHAGRTCYVRLRDEIPISSDEPAFISDTQLTTGANEIEYRLRIATRGLHQFGDCWVRLVGQWGLMELTRAFPVAQPLRVLPESLVPDDELHKQALDERRLLDQVRDTRNRGEGTEFESLSEFRESDDVRRIDWRSSARAGRLIVRRYQLEQHRDVVLLVDAGRLMGTTVDGGTKLDCAVDAALRIARVALQTGDRCGVGVFDSRVRGFLSPVAGADSHRILIDRLYDVKPAWVESNFAPMFAELQSRQRKRALLVLLSDIMESETTERYRAALVSLSHRHEVLFAALRTPLLRESASGAIEAPGDAARKAFAFRLMREREQTLHVLRRSGVHVLDVEPAQLTIPLLNAFLELRQNSVA